MHHLMMIMRMVPIGQMSRFEIEVIVTVVMVVVIQVVLVLLLLLHMLLLLLLLLMHKNTRYEEPFSIQSLKESASKVWFEVILQCQQKDQSN